MFTGSLTKLVLALELHLFVLVTIVMTHHLDTPIVLGTPKSRKALDVRFKHFETEDDAEFPAVLSHSLSST